jgi:hypothetical protein
MSKPLNSRSRFVFIVGAPRCGTTTLASFLQQHPDVCFSAVKEPHFFSRDEVAALSGEKLLDAVEHEYWQRFFGHCPGDPKLYAEGSVTYLYVPERMAPILNLWPEAKFVIALRDPLSMLPSLHARLLVTGDETIRSFPDAWSRIDERAQGKSIPKRAADPRWLRYDWAGRLGAVVERFLATVGAERCHIVLFDDLSRDPRGTYRELCSFLEIEPWDATDFEPQRINKTIRIGWLQRLLKRPPKAIRTALAGEHYHKREKKVGTSQGPALSAIFRTRKRLLEWNKVPAERKPLDPAVRADIIKRHRDDIILLSRIIGRDLSSWLGGVPEARPKALRKKAS